MDAREIKIEDAFRKQEEEIETMCADPMNSKHWKRGARQDILRTYLRLQKGKIGEHWLWCAVVRVAEHGEPVDLVLKDYGYVPEDM